MPDNDPDVNGRIDALGIEVIAWYVTFYTHSPPSGIYVRQHALEHFARRSFGSVTHCSDVEKLAFALQLVLDHELFHYWTDVAALQMELAAHRPIYLPYLRAHTGVHSSLCRLEEALANARVWRAASKSTRKRSTSVQQQFLTCTHQAFNQQPQGYKDWYLYKNPTDFRQGKQRFGAELLVADRPHEPAWIGTPFDLYFEEQKAWTDRVKVPIYLIPCRPVGRPFVSSCARPIHVTESRAFRKQLLKLPDAVRHRWDDNVKPDLQTGQWNGADFKKRVGHDRTFQCRVGRDYRVLFLHCEGNVYTAESIKPR